MLKKKFWICNKINPTTAEILLYGYISPYDISSADFIIELTQLCGLYSNIKIRINSGGGNVFEGLAIYNDIRSKIAEGYNIITCVDGIAASMAGVIFMAGQTRLISKYGRVMLHRAKAGAYGDAEDLRQQADLVENSEADLIKILAEHTGMSEDDVRKKFMQKGVDNWIGANQCIEYKLADEIYDAPPVQVPENVTDEKEVLNIFEVVLNQSNTNTSNMKEIAKALGLPENATEAEVLAAIKKNNEEKENARVAAENAEKAKAKTLVDTAINNKQLTEEDRAEYERMAVNNYDFTVKAIAKIPVPKKLSEMINRQDKNAEQKSGSSQEGKSEWEQLVAQGPNAVKEMKQNDPVNYKRMYEAHFNVPLPEQNV